MRRILIIVFLIVVVFLGYRYCGPGNEEQDTIEQHTALIQKQIANVGKLVVTEGHFAEVITYKSQNKYILDMLSFEKKALIVVNADVSVSYDLHQVKYEIDEASKTVRIIQIPKEEIKIDPQLTFYDVQQTSLSPFSGEDYNKVNKRVREDLMKKVQSSGLQANAENRLVSELSKMLILTSSMGWTLEYKGNRVASEAELQQKIKT